MKILSLGLALALLGTLAPAAALWGYGGEKGEATISGCLSEGEAEGSYVLTDKESGEETLAEGPEALADHLGHEVKLTGHWEKSEEGDKHFHASKVEHVSTDCPAGAGG